MTEQLIETTSEEYLLNMGPQHPSTHGAVRILLKLDGETIREATPDIGYIHRGLEKIAENRLYLQYIPLTDRLDYISSMNCNFAFVLSVESLAGIIPPPRAEYLRVIMAELNRLASHLLWLGTLCLDLGGITPFLYCFRERETIVTLFEMIAGSRLTYNYMRFGGVTRDMSPQFAKEAEAFLKDLKVKIGEYEGLLSQNPIFLQRTKGVGVISKELALSYALTGPSLRASNIKHDIRKASPYSIYDKFDFEVPVASNGDCWDRYAVRIADMRESIKILEQALSGIPEGPFKIKTPLKLSVPAGEIYIPTESPRGEFGFYLVSQGGAKPYRLKIRTPSFSNLSLLGELLKGCKIADLVSILGTIDIVMGEIDR